MDAKDKVCYHIHHEDKCKCTCNHNHTAALNYAITTCAQMFTSFSYYIQCGRSPLFWACKIDVAQLLINEGANVDVIDNVSSLVLGLHCLYYLKHMH